MCYVSKASCTDCVNQPLFTSKWISVVKRACVDRQSFPDRFTDLTGHAS